ncbi:hypothetical protein BT69DRAFT_1128018 [Atractiella rhizophila]|nr:hypothetical protein BT69DRAFT_1128018 [Atractiella rhizophila]
MSSTSTLVLSEGEFAQLKRVLEQSRAYTAACAGIYFWEYLQTLPREYGQIWKAPWQWSAMRVAFLVNRHFGLIFFIFLVILFWSDVPKDVCDKIHFLEPIGALILYICAWTILGMRAWAMWDQECRIGILILFTGITTVAVQIVCFRTDVPIFIPDGEVGCISNGGKGGFRIPYWLAALLYDTELLLLTIIPIMRYFRRGGSMPLLRLILRDGILYFIIVFSCNLLNFCWFVLPSKVVSNNALHAPAVTLLTSVMSSKLVLNVKDQQEQDSQRSASKPGGGGGGGDNPTYSFTAAQNSFGSSVQQRSEIPLHHLPNKSSVSSNLGNRSIGGGTLPVILEVDSRDSRLYTKEVLEKEKERQYWERAS